MAWRVCEVTRAGPIETGAVIIALRAVDENTGMPTDPPEFERYFYAFPSMQKEMLATALSAMSTGMLVMAGLPDSLAEESVIERLYLRPRPPP
jgi:hypothetical protein